MRQRNEGVTVCLLQNEDKKCVIFKADENMFNNDTITINYAQNNLCVTVQYIYFF